MLLKTCSYNVYWFCRSGFCFVEFESEEVVEMVMTKQYHDLAQGIKVAIM